MRRKRSWGLAGLTEAERSLALSHDAIERRHALGHVCERATELDPTRRREVPFRFDDVERRRVFRHVLEVVQEQFRQEFDARSRSLFGFGEERPGQVDSLEVLLALLARQNVLLERVERDTVHLFCGGWSIGSGRGKGARFGLFLTRVSRMLSRSRRELEREREGEGDRDREIAREARVGQSQCQFGRSASSRAVANQNRSRFSSGFSPDDFGNVRTPSRQRFKRRKDSRGAEYAAVSPKTRNSLEFI